MIEGQEQAQSNGNPADTARKVLEMERQKRIAAFNADLAALCQKHNCELVPRVLIVGDQFVTDVSVRVKD
jgi:hypothetical protein